MVDEERVEKWWLSYKAQVVPAAAGRGQVSETRRAFYAGTVAMYYALLAHTREGVPDREGVEFLQRVDRELARYYRLIGRGDN